MTAADNFLAQDKCKWDALNASDAAAKAQKRIVGRYITHQYADGQAVYRITGLVGRTQATIEVVDVGDAWVLPAWGKKKNIAISTIDRFLQQRDGLAALFARTDDWWINQTIGDTVHYDNSFDQYVRGRIVLHEGEKKMLPIALVGKGWRPHEISTRRPTGEIRYGHHAKEIRDKKPWQPNASTMVEHAGHKLRGTDPRGLAPISLQPPAMTPDQVRLAGVAKLHEAVLATLKHEHDADPAKLADAMAKSLRMAKHLFTSPEFYRFVQTEEEDE